MYWGAIAQLLPYAYLHGEAIKCLEGQLWQRSHSDVGNGNDAAQLIISAADISAFTVVLKREVRHPEEHMGLQDEGHLLCIEIVLLVGLLQPPDAVSRGHQHRQELRGVAQQLDDVGAESLQHVMPK